VDRACDRRTFEVTMPSNGNTHQRGYGHAHQQLRADWARRVATGSIHCARCGRPIAPHEKWDLGHDDWDRTQYRGPEHRTCNRRAAAIKGNRLRRRRSSRLTW
jgi:hypothetical protein